MTADKYVSFFDDFLIFVGLIYGGGFPKDEFPSQKIIANFCFKLAGKER